MKRLPLLLLPWLLSFAACTSSSHRPVDSFGAYNTLGGAARGNDFSLFDTAPAANLDAERFDSLKRGFLGPPLPLADGGLAVLSDEGVLALIRYRSLLRTIPFPANEHPLPGIAADASSQLYVATTAGTLFAIDSVGNTLWHKPIAAGGSALYYSGVLALDEGAVIGASDGSLRRFDRTGRKLWEIRRGAPLAGTIAGDPGLGLAVAVSFNDYDRTDTLLIVDPASGAERWARAVEHGRIVYGPIIAHDMIVIGGAERDSSGNRLPFIEAFAPGGNRLWRASLPIMPHGISTDDQGNVYVTGSGAGREFIGGALISFDRAGKRRWQVMLESGVPAAPVVSKGWIYFIARRNDRTGLFTYDRNGLFAKFVAIDMLPDVHAQATISSDGVLLLSALELPAFLQGSGKGILELF